jgi:hypothetical protein
MKEETMKKRSVASSHAKSKPKSSEKTPEKRPTRMEHAEVTTIFVDYSNSQDEDLARVTVAAQKTARALELASRGSMAR